MPVRRVVWAVAALAASTLLVTAAPAQAAPGRAYVVNKGSDTVSVVDTATNAVLTTIAVGNGPEGAAATPDGSKVYVVNADDRTVSVIRTASDTVVATVALGGLTPRSVAVTPDGARAWVAGYGGVAVIDTASDTVVGTVPGVSFALNVVLSPDGSRAYLPADEVLLVVDTATLAVVAAPPAGHSPFEVEVSPDGSRAYVASAASDVRVFETATNTLVAQVSVPGSTPLDLAVSPDGTRLYLVAGSPASMVVLDARTLAEVARVPVDFRPWGVAVSPTGDRVYVTGNTGFPSNGRLAVVDTATNAVVATVAVGNNPLHVVVISAIPQPPPAPVVEGATFYTDGTSARAGVAPGSRVSAFTSSAVPGLDYRLVLSGDGCRTVVAVLNATPRFANASGVIGPTAGVVPAGTPAGRYQVCFLAPNGGGATVTGPATLDVA